VILFARQLWFSLEDAGGVLDMQYESRSGMQCVNAIHEVLTYNIVWHHKMLAAFIENNTKDFY
jgi:hypothetical protein